MGVIDTFLMSLIPAPRRGIHARYCKSGQQPASWGVTGPANTVFLVLNCLLNKLCPQTSAAPVMQQMTVNTDSQLVECPALNRLSGSHPTSPRLREHWRQRGWWRWLRKNAF